MTTTTTETAKEVLRGYGRANARRVRQCTWRSRPGSRVIGACSGAEESPGSTGHGAR